MFYTIFSFELRYWLKRPLFYIYSAIFFALSVFAMAASAGLFEGVTVTINSITKVNSASGINALLNEMTLYLYFLLPSIIGSTINKDYRYEMHSIMYSYPFKKWEYIFAKFLSGLFISIVIIIISAIGIMLGSVLPGTNPDLLGPFVMMNYVTPFLYYVIPNLIFYGAKTIAP